MSTELSHFPENSPSATPITRRKLGHEVLERLLVGIRSGAYPIGSLLPSERATADDIVHLHEALERQRASLGHPERFLDTDLALHRLIAAVSGNPVYVAVSQAMLQWLSNFHEDLVRAPGAEVVTVEEHERLVTCIARHDPDGAEQAMKDHLTRAHQSYRSGQ
mgnify:CR=1 FL=1